VPENTNKLLEEMDNENLPFSYDQSDEHWHDYDRRDDKNDLIDKFSNDSLKQQ